MSKVLVLLEKHTKCLAIILCMLFIKSPLKFYHYHTPHKHASNWKHAMQCKQAHDYAHIKCKQSKLMSLLPLLVCFSSPRILILLNSSMLLPLCLLSLSKSLIAISLSQSLPFVIYFHKSASLDTKGCIGVDGWHLNLEFFMDTTTYVGMHHL
jgi:hypothetical protein